ncbi:hypothetical protein CWE13_07930 [Aliidiomarina shirensis]|uniref:Cyanophycinase n=1 Tax=Aliidiomarina shirensis TaxID=1048642 RepID=A0A432WSM3_9GAMM|nr:cyanophycinase [Aliidiomarina shirensis]RUO36770.1 hypothetical protein CWE13_07930 [Aliidiomarina shirensis]
MFVVKRFKWLLSLLFIFTFTVVAEAEPSAGNVEKVEWNLMLVGGSMNTCSSISAGRCSDESWIDSATMRTITYADFREENIQRILAESNWSGSSETRQKTAEMLNAAKRRFSDNSTTMSDFSAFFRELYPNLWRDITTPQWYLIRDHLQASEAQDAPEVSRPDLSKQPEGADLFLTFANRARQLAEAENQEPLVLVVTASGRDSFDAVDFYLETFRVQGVSAEWLPIDAAFGHAVAANECDALPEYRGQYQQSFARERVYPWLAEIQKRACENPESLLDLVERAHGVFINGGDQSLTRQAFFKPDGSPTNWLNSIRARVFSGQMIAGGTSAGTAVMSGNPMITNGSSDAGLREGAFAMTQPPAADCARFDSCKPAVSADSLTYNREGGLDLFPFGILDTHFSERGRQGRLLALQIATEAPFAVGVDETTALLVNTYSGDFRVQGAHGVFVQAHPDRTDTGLLARFSYLRNGTSGKFSKEDGIVEIAFNTQAQGDSGASGSSQFLRDRSITSALQACAPESEPAHYFQEYNGISVLLAFDQFTRTANEKDGCEVVNGIIHFAVEDD